MTILAVAAGAMQFLLSVSVFRRRGYSTRVSRPMNDTFYGQHDYIASGSNITPAMLGSVTA